ncbi:MAG: DNA polymerase III subunit delta' [Myxococcota bacterium]|nr:DNA polymerase III subunit delta' [Myxococcota bacterium]
MLLGNEILRERLKRLAKTQRLHHCLLFEGPSGVGKSQTARWLAKLLNCEKGTVCNNCWSCRTIEQDEHPDILNIGLDPQRTAPIISVRQARELIKKIQVHPYRAKQRVVILNPAEAMRIETANAMLKTLEEPPSSTTFILICSAAAQMIATVRSRSQRIRFRPVAREVLSKWFVDAREHQDPILLEHILSLSDGCPGRALKYMEDSSEWMGLRDDFLHVLGQGVGQQVAWAERFCAGEKQRWLPRLNQLLDLAETLLRDLFLMWANAESPLYHNDIRERLSRFRCCPRALSSLFQQLATARADLVIHVNGRLILESLVINFSESLVSQPGTILEMQ